MVETRNPLTAHPREAPFRRAVLEGKEWLLRWEERHDVTPSEMVAFMGECLIDFGHRSVRAERADDETEED